MKPFPYAAGLATALAFTSLSCGRSPERPNLLLITIDTLRADHVGAYGYPLATTPNLDALAREGVRFAEAYAAAPITAPSHATLLTGRWPLRHGVLTNGLYLLNDPAPTLAERLRERGYHTAAFVGGVPLDHRFGFARGFEHYDDDFSRSVLRGLDLSPWYEVPLLSRERRAAEVVAPALAWLEKNASQGPFFLWVHLFDPHSPYSAPPPFEHRFSTGHDPRNPEDHSLDALWARPQSWHQWLRGVTDADYVRALYDGEIAYADAELGRLLVGLEQLGHKSDTVVVATADHGEGLGEHDEWFFHGDLVYESTLRVPLIVRAPWSLAAGKVARVRARGVDLLPTVLELLALPAATGIDGESLVRAATAGTVELRPVLAEAAYRDRSGRGAFAYLEGHLKVIARDAIPGTLATTECYDLASDPRELQSLCVRRADDFAEPRSHLEAMRREIATGEASAGVLPPEVKEALDSLGYTNH